MTPIIIFKLTCCGGPILREKSTATSTLYESLSLYQPETGLLNLNFRINIIININKTSS